MSNIAIIPARGGSKRIPRKNIKEFCGQPIIKYSIDAAVKSGLFDKIIVSTDSAEIAEISKKYGAEVPFMRSFKNSDDNASLAEVIDEVKIFYEKKFKKFKYICCILSTAPLIDVKDLKTSFLLLKEKKVDSVRPVVRFSYPVQRAVRLNGNKIEMLNPEYKFTRSQDLESLFHDAGQFYWMRFDKGLYGKNNYGFEISEIRAQDIDTQDDWILAEQKYKFYTKSENKF